MFRSHNSQQTQKKPAQDPSGLTGLERAKLERTYAPQPSRTEDLPPHLVVVEKPKAIVAPPKPSAPQKPVAGAKADTAHLYVGPGVTLKGEIFGCDTLRVEGCVEGNASARSLTVCSSGSFLGTVEIEEGDVEGKFDGTLNVAGRLFLRATGRICGTLSYGQIEVERGGEILGDIAVRGTASASRPQVVSRAADPVSFPAKPAAQPGPEPLKKPSLLSRG
jgi:cytoskeletal protein CcmA (bactofilin family)